MSIPISQWAIILGIACIAGWSVRGVQSYAVRRALFDVPNERSSHKVPVPRLGGAAFIPVVLTSLVALWWSSSLPLPLRSAYFAGAIGLFTVSLVDDFYTLSTSIRFVVQFAAAGSVVVMTLVDRPMSELNGVGVAIAGVIIVGIVGFLNIYNFMDGIDGIAGMQGVVAGLAWGWFAMHMGGPTSAALGLALAAGALGFLTLNWPPAKIFMGDAGSTVLGYSFAVLPLLVWVETKPAIGFFALLGVGILVVWPFLADGVFTILCRLRKRENILKAHRSHLYQRLVIAGKSHQVVTLVYGGLAMVGAILGSLIIRGYVWTIPLSVGVILVLFGLLWRWTVVCEERAGVRSRTLI